MNDGKDQTESALLPHIAKATFGVSMILGGIKVLGFVEKVLLARYFGTGYQADAYFVAFSLMIAFWDILRGLLSPSYLPTLLEYRARVGEKQSWQFTSTILNALSVMFIVLTLIGLLFTPQLVRTMTRDFDEQAFHVAVGLTRLMLTGAGFFAIAILTGLTLNSYKRFLLAVMDDVVFKVSGLLGLILLARYVGIYGLAWGIALGSWIAPFLHLVGLRKFLPWYTLRIDFASSPLRKMARLMAPLVPGTIAIESRRLIDNFFASKFQVGSVSALAFGYKLIEFAYVAIAEPLAVVVLPYFSDLAIKQQRDTLSDTVFTTLRTIILLFTPMAVCLFMLRYSVVRVLFERGAFDAGSTQLTVTALTFYALGLVSFAVEILLAQTYFSLSDTVTPAMFEVMTLAVHVGFILLLQGKLAHGAIALAFTLSKTLKVLVLYGLLTRKLADIQLKTNSTFLAKLALAVGIMASLMWGYQTWFTAQFALPAFMGQALLIITSGGFGCLVFFASLFLLKVREIRLIIRALVGFMKQFIARHREDTP